MNPRNSNSDAMRDHYFSAIKFETTMPAYKPWCEKRLSSLIAIKYKNFLANAKKEDDHISKQLFWSKLPSWIQNTSRSAKLFKHFRRQSMPACNILLALKDSLLTALPDSWQKQLKPKNMNNTVCQRSTLNAMKADSIVSPNKAKACLRHDATYVNIACLFALFELHASRNSAGTPQNYKHQANVLLNIANNARTIII